MESLKAKDIAGMIEKRDNEGLNPKKSADLIRYFHMQKKVTEIRLKMQNTFDAQRALHDLRRESLERSLRRPLDHHEMHRESPSSSRIIHSIEIYRRKIVKRSGLSDNTQEKNQDIPAAPPIDTSAPRPPRAVDSTPVAPKAPEPKAA